MCGGRQRLRAKATVEEYRILIEIRLFKIIKLYSKIIKNKKGETIKKGKLLTWLDKKLNTKIEEDIKDFTQFLIKERKRIFKKETWETMRALRINITELNTNIEVGTENAIATSYLVATIASIISIFLAHNVKPENAKNFKYKTTPRYGNQNFIKMETNCIIAIKMVHIISTIYRLIKRSGKKYDGASNRRSYGYGNEQYSGHG